MTRYLYFSQGVGVFFSFVLASAFVVLFRPVGSVLAGAESMYLGFLFRFFLLVGVKRRRGDKFSGDFLWLILGFALSFVFHTGSSSLIGGGIWRGLAMSHQVVVPLLFWVSGVVLAETLHHWSPTIRNDEVLGKVLVFHVFGVLAAAAICLLTWMYNLYLIGVPFDRIDVAYSLSGTRLFKCAASNIVFVFCIMSLRWVFSFGFRVDQSRDLNVIAFCAPSFVLLSFYFLLGSFPAVLLCVFVFIPSVFLAYFKKPPIARALAVGAAPFLVIFPFTSELFLLLAVSSCFLSWIVVEFGGRLRVNGGEFNSIKRDVLFEFQSRGAVWLVKIDFAQRRAVFPLGLNSDTHVLPTLSLDDFLRGARMADILSLMQKLQSEDTPAGFLMRMQLRAPALVSDQARQTSDFDVHMLKNAHPICWLLLSEVRHDVSRGEEHYDRSEVQRRDELDLLDLVRELSSPLGELCRFFDARGAEPDSQDISTVRALGKMVETLSGFGIDVRPAPPVVMPFTPRQVVQRVDIACRKAFDASAKALRIDLPRQADSRILGDADALVTVLVRLLSAITPTSPDTIGLTLVVPKSGSDEMKLVWQITAPGADLKLFPDELPDQLARLCQRLTATLVDQSDADGLRFILTHDCRADHHTDEVATAVDPDVPLAEISVLLVEENRRLAHQFMGLLQRYVRHVQWAETGQGAVRMGRQTPPDIILTGPLYGNLSASETVQRLREAGVEAPVVGMIDAQTETQIEALRAAGVTLILPRSLTAAHIPQIIALVDYPDAAPDTEEDEVPTASFARDIGPDGAPSPLP